MTFGSMTRKGREIQARHSQYARTRSATTRESIYLGRLEPQPSSPAAMRKVLFILGTPPEAINLCPVLLHMRTRPDEFSIRVCATAQHRGMLDQVLNVFRVTPD